APGPVPLAVLVRCDPFVCTTQFRIACADGSNSVDNSTAVRPRLTSPIICYRNSFEYAGCVLPFCPFPSWSSFMLRCPRNRVNFSIQLNARQLPAAVVKVWRRRRTDHYGHPSRPVEDDHGYGVHVAGSPFRLAHPTLDISFLRAAPHRFVNQFPSVDL